MKDIFDCKLNDSLNNKKGGIVSNDLKYEINDDANIKSIHDCFYRNEEADIIDSCKDYCSSFNLTKINNLIEGNLGSLKQFVEYVKERITEISDNPENALIDDVNQTLSFINQDMANSANVSEFFIPTNQNNMIDEMRGDVLAFSGINPYKPGKDNYYTIKIKENETIYLLSAFIYLVISFINL